MFCSDVLQRRLAACPQLICLHVLKVDLILELPQIMLGSHLPDLREACGDLRIRLHLLNLLHRQALHNGCEVLKPSSGSLAQLLLRLSLGRLL